MLENGVPSEEIGTFLTYSSLVRAQPFLSLPYVSIKTPFLVSCNDTGQEWSMLFTSQSMKSKQRCIYGHPLIFVVLAQSKDLNLLSFRANLHLSYNPAGRSHCRLLNHHGYINPYSAEGLRDRLYATLHKFPGEVGYSFCLFLKS